MRPRCAGRTVAGRPCRKLAREDAPFCHLHEPARRHPAECIAGPLDGTLMPLRHCRVRYALRHQNGMLAVVPAGDYWRYVRAGYDANLVGRYRLVYDGLKAFWEWTRTPAAVGQREGA